MTNRVNNNPLNTPSVHISSSSSSSTRRERIDNMTNTANAMIVFATARLRNDLGPVLSSVMSRRAADDNTVDVFTESTQHYNNERHLRAARISTGDFFLQLINNDLKTLTEEEARKNYIEKIETFDPDLMLELIKKAIKQALSSDDKECPAFLRYYLDDYAVSYKDGYLDDPNYNETTKICKGLKSIRQLKDDKEQEYSINEIATKLLVDPNCSASLQKAFRNFDARLIHLSNIQMLDCSSTRIIDAALARLGNIQMLNLERVQL